MEKNSFKVKVRNWLIQHPEINPYEKYFPDRLFRRLTCPIRILPDFLIIGAEKSGTTSLYDYIIQHPSVFPSMVKEVEFFENKFSKEICFYKSNFPTKLSKFYFEKLKKIKFFTGEATPTYFFYPHAPNRVAKFLPQVKLIIILRNPVDRAYSNYNHSIRGKTEKLSFEEAIKSEKDRLNPELSLIEKDDTYLSYSLRHHAYLLKGIYLKHIEMWQKYFDKENFFIFSTEELQNNPNKIVNEVFSFLELEKYDIVNLKKLNTGKYEEMKLETRNYLIEYFKPYNEKLFNLIGKTFDWEK